MDELRAKLGLERFHLAGNSLGGFLSWYYAARFPERVDRLILVSPIAYPQPLPPIMKLIATPLIGDFARFIAPRAIVEHNVREVYGNPSAATPATVNRYYELLQRSGNRSAMVSTIRALKSYATHPTLSHGIRKIRSPTLLMWGCNDRWVPMSLLERWRRDLPHALVKVYLKGGHIPMEELPHETAADAHAFLTGETGSQAAQRDAQLQA
jgi:pimeloyl-ACP methyl ester carboxylesterase